MPTPGESFGQSLLDEAQQDQAPAVSPVARTLTPGQALGKSLLNEAAGPYAAPSGARLLHPEVAGAFRDLSDAAKAQGLEVRLNSGDRSAAQQQPIWDRSAPTSNPNIRIQRAGRQVARPGVSRHQRGLAADMEFFRNGQRVDPRLIIPLARAHGFQWAGPADDVHFDYRAAKPATLAELHRQEGNLPPVLPLVGPVPSPGNATVFHPGQAATPGQQLGQSLLEEARVPASAADYAATGTGKNKPGPHAAEVAQQLADVIGPSTAIPSNLPATVAAAGGQVYGPPASVAGRAPFANSRTTGAVPPQTFGTRAEEGVAPHGAAQLPAVGALPANRGAEPIIQRQETIAGPNVYNPTVGHAVRPSTPLERVADVASSYPFFGAKELHTASLQTYRGLQDQGKAPLFPQLPGTDRPQARLGAERQLQQLQLSLESAAASIKDPDRFTSGAVLDYLKNPVIGKPQTLTPYQRQNLDSLVAWQRFRMRQDPREATQMIKDAGTAALTEVALGGAGALAEGPLAAAGGAIRRAAPGLADVAAGVAKQSLVQAAGRVAGGALHTGGFGAIQGPATHAQVHPGASPQELLNVAGETAKNYALFGAGVGVLGEAFSAAVGRLFRDAPGPLPTAEIARQTGRDPQAVLQHLTQLEQAGQVQRTAKGWVRGAPPPPPGGPLAARGVVPEVMASEAPAAPLVTRTPGAVTPAPTFAPGDTVRYPDLPDLPPLKVTAVRGQEVELAGPNGQKVTTMVGRLERVGALPVTPEAPHPAALITPEERDAARLRRLEGIERGGNIKPAAQQELDALRKAAAEKLQPAAPQPAAPPATPFPTPPEVQPLNPVHPNAIETRRPQSERDKKWLGGFSPLVMGHGPGGKGPGPRWDAQPNLAPSLSAPGAVYHETSGASAKRLVAQFNSGGHGRTGLQVTNNLDLAHGQAGGGVILEIDPERVHGYPSVLNGGKAMAEALGQGGEFTLDRYISDPVDALIVKTQRSLDALSKDPVVNKLFDFSDTTPAERGTRVPRRRSIQASEARPAEAPATAPQAQPLNPVRTWARLNSGKPLPGSEVAGSVESAVQAAFDARKLHSPEDVRAVVEGHGVAPPVAVSAPEVKQAPPAEPVTSPGESMAPPVEPVHHSQLQPRTPEGLFDGPPVEGATVKEGLTVGPEPAKVTALNARTTAEEVAAGKLSSAPAPSRGMGPEEALNYGRKVLADQGENAIAHAEGIARQAHEAERPFTRAEHGVINAANERLVKEHDRLGDALAKMGPEDPQRPAALAQYEGAKSRLQDFRDTAQTGLGELGGSLGVARGGVDLDSGSYSSVVREIRKVSGRDEAQLSSAERATLKALTERFGKLEDVLPGLEALDAARKAQAEEAAPTRTTTRAARVTQLKTEEAKIKDQMREIANRLAGRTSADLGGSLYDAGEWVHSAGKLALNRIRQGSESLDEAIEHAIEHLKGLGVTATRADVVQDIRTLTDQTAKPLTESQKANLNAARQIGQARREATAPERQAASAAQQATRDAERTQTRQQATETRAQEAVRRQAEQQAGAAEARTQREVEKRSQAAQRAAEAPARKSAAARTLEAKRREVAQGQIDELERQLASLDPNDLKGLPKKVRSDPSELLKALRERRDLLAHQVQARIDAAKPATAGDWVQTYIVNSALSNPKLPVVKSIGNAISAAAAFPERLVRAAADVPLSRLQNRPRAAYAAEAARGAAAYWSALPNAARDMLNVLKTGVSGYERPGSAEFELPRREFPGGYATNFATRNIAGIRAFFLRPSVEGELAAQATRAALREGATGPAFQARFEHWLQNPTPEMLQAVERQSQFMTFHGDLLKGETGSMAEGLIRGLERVANASLPDDAALPWARGVKPIRAMIPFIRTTYEIMRAGSKYSPIGLADLGVNARTPEAATTIGRAAVGTALMAAVAPLVAQGRVTGGLPKGSGERRQWAEHNIQPYSVYEPASKRWVSYSHLGLPVVPMAQLTEMIDAWNRTGKAPLPHKIAAAGLGFVGGTAEGMGRAGIFAGMEKLIGIARDPKTMLPAVQEELATKPIPLSGALREIVKGTDPLARKPTDAATAIKANIPGLSRQVQPRRAGSARNAPPLRHATGIAALSPLEVSLPSRPKELARPPAHRRR